MGAGVCDRDNGYMIRHGVATVTEITVLSRSAQGGNNCGRNVNEYNRDGLMSLEDLEVDMEIPVLNFGKKSMVVMGVYFN